MYQDWYHVFVGGVEHCFLIVHDPAVSLNARPQKARLVDAEMELRLVAGRAQEPESEQTFAQALSIAHEEWAPHGAADALQNVCERQAVKWCKIIMPRQLQYVAKRPVADLNW